MLNMLQVAYSLLFSFLIGVYPFAQYKYHETIVLVMDN